MAKSDSDDKIKKYPSWLRNLNIGTLMFGIIFAYLLIALAAYMMDEHIASYEVIEGTISGNYRYSALALKAEEIVTAQESGNVTYYAREGARANAGLLICAVGQTSASVMTNAEPDEDDYEQARSDMVSFSLNFDDSRFQSVYDLKADLQALILQNAINEDAGVYVTGSYTAPVSGFVLYFTDGYEGLDESSLSEELFSRNDYEKENLRLKTSVSAGDTLYSLVTGDTWYLYFPVTAQLATELEGRTRIQFRFLKDKNSFSAPFELVTGTDGQYGKITLNHSLVRYVRERFLDIELVISRVKGLKIPVSAIADKVFYKIPKEYVIVNENTDSEITILLETFNSDGSSQTRYVTATVYDKTEDGSYLVSTDLFDVGDYILMVDTNKNYQIRESDLTTISGVYNINKGYAIFREVTVLDRNEEFCIVEPNNVYSLSAHDRIVLNASKVSEGDIIS